jgi:hypothetical protein
MTRLTDQMAGLAAMSQAQLRAEWRRIHKGQMMPSGLGRDLATRAITWKLQERVQGGMPPATSRELRRLADQLRGTGEIDIARDIRLKPGTRLVRQWHGRVFHVLVLEDGFLFEDRQYRSLTPIAREITGAAWSGPRFFGIRERAKR